MSPLRRAAKRDKCEAGIVAALRAAGCSVAYISEKGLPDLLVGRAGVNTLMECKDAKDGKLTEDQHRWVMGWNGQYAVVHNELEALAAVGLRGK